MTVLPLAHTRHFIYITANILAPIYNDVEPLPPSGSPKIIGQFVVSRGTIIVPLLLLALTLPVFKLLSSPLICCFFFEKFGFIIDQWVHGNNILMGPCEVLGDSMEVRVHTAQNWKKKMAER
jgi:hypothetical protein